MSPNRELVLAVLESGHLSRGQHGGMCLPDVQRVPHPETRQVGRDSDAALPWQILLNAQSEKARGRPPNAAPWGPVRERLGDSKRRES
jgi:hypothetical protein